MDNKINHIIARVLSGESSSGDILSLSEWLNENQNNREEFHRLKTYWDADVAFKYSVAPTLSAEELQQKINIQEKRIKKIYLRKNAVSLIAAVALLFIISTAFLFYYTNNYASEYYTLLTDEHKSGFTMEDGTVVTLNKNSRLSYSDKYGKNKREVKLEGEAFFEVAKDTGKPFEVEMNGVSVVVLGTHFNIKADVGSDHITATLVEGAICFEGPEENIVMTPNQQLIYNRSDNKIDIKQVDTDIFTAWKNGLLKYKSIPFIELIEELKNIYHVDIQIESKELMRPTETVTGTFSSEQNIEQILKVISRSLPIRWTNSDGVYYIKYRTL